MRPAVLSIRDLSVSVTTRRRSVCLVRSIDLDLRPGTVHALVGESGAGKTLTARAVIGLLPRGFSTAGSVWFGGSDLLRLDQGTMREVRGRRIAMIFQQPDRHLNPSMRIGTQIVEVLRYHLGLDRDAALDRTAELMQLVELSDRSLLRSYPHELSGGMKQRVMIAMAIACSPEVLIADEPTTALDVTVQSQILALLDSIRTRLGTSILFISHDLPLVRAFADDVSVMYAGRIVEQSDADRIFDCAHHPYTERLIASTPDPARRGERLAAIAGTVPDPDAIPAGCAFAPRCFLANKRCTVERPVLRQTDSGRRSACHFAESLVNGCAFHG